MRLYEEHVAHFVFTTFIMKLLWTVVGNSRGEVWDHKNRVSFKMSKISNGSLVLHEDDKQVWNELYSLGHRQTFLTPLPFGCHLMSLDRVHPGKRNM